MSYAHRIASARISLKDIAGLKDRPVQVDKLPFVSERGGKLDNANPFAILEGVVAAASEPSLRGHGKDHLSEKFRTPDGVVNANRVLRTQLDSEVRKLAHAAEGTTELPLKESSTRAFAAARAVFNAGNELGARAQKMLDTIAERLGLGNLQEVAVGRRGGR